MWRIRANLARWWHEVTTYASQGAPADRQIDAQIDAIIARTDRAIALLQETAEKFGQEEGNR